MCARMCTGEKKRTIGSESCPSSVANENREFPALFGGGAGSEVLGAERGPGNVAVN